MTRSKIIRRCVGWAMGVIFVLSLVVWNVTRETLPREVRIATAAHGGLYHKFAEALAPHIEQRTGRTVTLLETEGTADNVHRLLDRKADLAILQSGAMFLNGVVALAPLYHDVVFIVARKDRGIGTFRDLAGGKVAIGLPGSGMRSSAVALLDHYDIGVGSPHHTDQYFLDLLDDESLDAAIITTGFMNPDLERLLATGDFTIVPVHEAEAFCLRNPSFEPMSIPRGLYGHGPALPAEPVATVATTAVLAASEHTSSVLITETLDTFT